MDVAVVIHGQFVAVNVGYSNDFHIVILDLTTLTAQCCPKATAVAVALGFGAVITACSYIYYLGFSYFIILAS